MATFPPSAAGPLPALKAGSEEAAPDPRFDLASPCNRFQQPVSRCLGSTPAGAIGEIIQRVAIGVWGVARSGAIVGRSGVE